ncbi:hypothetical protein N1F78_12075 [Seonamhaeicola sp. MEBiC1930]|uniref:hypothetical protein n=1 Tax=Seonamhaeicola sp. MEBiC01930 TaxID=2976768 RepID=UPI0032462B7E
MENRTEFNLKNNIEIWKSELSKKSIMTLDNINELESHLLDLIDDLESKGLTIEESFLIARKRIGRIDDICTEFDKVNNFSFIKTTIPYLKGALTYISFIILSKLFLVSTLLLSQYMNIDNSKFNIASIILLTIFSISFFGVLYFNLKKRKSFLSKLSSVYVLVSLIAVSYIISIRLSAEVVLPGIDINKFGNPIAEFHTMELNFGIYKILCGIILLTTSIVLFWKNKKNNKLRYTE